MAKAPKGEDLFSEASEFITATEASAIAGVSYQKFLNEFWDLNFKYLYPGGPRIYMKAEVEAYLEGKNKNK